MLNLSHKNLTTWEKSLELVKEIYLFCDKLPDKEKYIIIPQLKRAAISVSSNIENDILELSD
ncbi:MAG: four helix bundle protein [Ignavibacteriae bacterium]|nr:four helix bundle protein [Ignavibacteriota bacterium]